MSASLILASGSAIRASILTNAGVDFDVVKPGVDEDVIKKSSAKEGLSLEKTALALADAKALAVAADAGVYVLGSDQILEFQGRAFDKPKNLDEARDRLADMQADSHTLINAVSIAHEGRIVFRHLERPRLHLRAMSKAEIDQYIEEAGPAILSSVGAYQVEKLGARLFERIEGDYFSVLGLSLFPTLAFLRKADVVAY